MYARVVRFTDVTPDRISEIQSEVESGGPPDDVPAKSLKIVYDEDQSTAVVIFLFDTEEDMKKADEALEKMDAGDTPGSRASIDQGEVKAQMDV